MVQNLFFFFEIEKFFKNKKKLLLLMIITAMEMKCLTILSIWWSLQMIIIIESINFGHNNHNNREFQSNIDQ
mgnify:CR=1 FL=1